MGAINTDYLRLKEFMEYAKERAASISQKTGIEKGSVSRILSGKQPFTADSMVKVLRAYNIINPDWLINGIPPMLKKDIDYMSKLCEKSEYVLEDIMKHEGVTLADIRRWPGMENVDGPGGIISTLRGFTYKEVRAICKRLPDINIFWVISHDKNEPMYNESRPLEKLTNTEKALLERTIELKDEQIKNLTEILLAKGKKS